jgi:hypothetical protein
VHSPLVREDTDPLVFTVDNSGGGEGDEVRWTLGVEAHDSLLLSGDAALEEVVQWAERVAVASVEHLDCDIWSRSAAASNAWQLLRVAERLSAAADMVDANTMHRALVRARLQSRQDDSEGRKVAQRLLVVEEEAANTLVIGSFFALFRALWSTRDAPVLASLLSEGATTNPRPSSSAVGVLGLLSRRALARVGCAKESSSSFSWCKAWASTLPRGGSGFVEEPKVPIHIHIHTHIIYIYMYTYVYIIHPTASWENRT